MQRDRQHPRIVVEGGLHAVAVVDVDVDVGHPLGAGGQQGPDRQHHVVEHAEPGGRIRASRGAGRRRCSPRARRGRARPAARPAGSRRRSAPRRRTCRRTPGCRRCPGRSRGSPGSALAARTAARYSARVHGQQLLLVGRHRLEHREPVQHAQAAGQRDGQVQPDRRHRVLAEVVVRGSPRPRPGWCGSPVSVVRRNDAMSSTVIPAPAAAPDRRTGTPARHRRDGVADRRAA